MTAPQSDTTARSSEVQEVARGSWLTAPSTARIAPFAAYMVFIAIADLLQRLGWTPEQLLWLYPVKIAVVVALLALFWRRYGELRPLRLSAGAAAAIATGAIVFLLWINLDASWMQIGEAGGYDPSRQANASYWILVACRLAGAALVVPVMEELFWRSFLQRWLEKPQFLLCAPAAVGIKALVITSVLFGFEHNLWFAGVVAGLAYGFLYMRAGTLLAPVIAHAVTNGMLGIWVFVTGSWTYW